MIGGGGRGLLAVAALWVAAGLVAIAGHAAIAAIALNWTSGNSAPSAAPPVLMISLAPVSAPQVPEQQVAPGPQAADSMPQEEQKLPEKAVAMLPPVPQPKPELKPEPHERPVEAEKKRKKTEHRVASRAAAPTTFDAPRAAQANAPASGAARVSVAALVSWRSELMAQLNRYKRYPAGGSSSGTATVVFSINRSGAVTSARLVRSSGDAALDQEAVALPRRASPLPKPPEGVASNLITVPIHFDR